MSEAAGPGGEDFAHIHVDYTAGDIVAMQLAAWRYWLTTATLPFFLFGLLSMIPVMTGEEDLLTAIASIDWSVAAVLSAILIGALMATLWVGYTIRRVRGKHSNILLGISNEGVNFRGPDGEGTIFWKSVKRVSANERRLMFFLSSNSAMIVPKRYFSDSAVFDRWVAFSNAKWGDARGLGNQPRNLTKSVTVE